MKAQILTLIILLAAILNSNATDSKSKLFKRNNVATGIKIGLNESRDFHIPPPACFTDKSGNLASKTNFVVDFSNNVPNKLRQAFNIATGIWESLINTPIDIRIHVYWNDLEGNTLASCAATTYYLGYDGMSYPNTYYPVSLAEKMTGKQLNDSSEYDLIINVDSKANWYYGTDGKTPADKYDLVSVLLHEICHGLGFSESFYVQNDIGGWGLSSGYGLIYEKFITDSKGRHVTDTTVYPINSKELKNVLTGGILYFEGPYLMNDYGKKVNLYVPSTWDPGSSVSHLNTMFSSSNPLMISTSSMGESIHDPGVIAIDVLSDIGWKQIYIEHEPVTNSEDIKNVTVEAKIYSDFDSEIFNPKLFYSVDSAEYVEKALVKSSSDNKKYSAVIPVTKSSNISYYITADDKFNRKFTVPVYATEESYGFYIGADTLPPEISHYPNTFLLPGQDSILINANVTDGFGIDTVWVEYSYNDIVQSPVGMNIFKETQYQLELDISYLNINDGDSIKYRIVARDKSKSGNLAYLPDSGWTVVNVEAIPDFVESFENNFEATNTDFILQGFSFETPDGFKNGALHSVHPYSEAGDKNYLEYIAQLRYPVKVSETNHFISFDEIVLVEPGEPGTKYGDDEFWDYVIIEASKDDGKTWSYLEPGWDCRINTDWYNSYTNLMDGQFSKAIGTQGMFKNHLIDLFSSGRIKIGDEIIIRFRLYSDPFANGWGWVIDNLKIQTEGLAARKLALDSEIKIYPNPVEGNMINISAKNSKIEEVLFYNMQGSLVFRTNKVLNDGIVYLPETLKGGFIVIVKTENQTSHSKLLIK